MSAGLSQFAERVTEQRRSVTPGFVIGIVTNNKDEDGLSRVKVRYPGLGDLNDSGGFWARVVTPMAGPDRGLYFLPEIDDEVLVMFENGDVRFPYVIGALWNGKDKAPADNSDGKNNLRVIKSRSGHLIKLNDEEGKETVEIIDASGKNSIVIDTAANSITISADKDITLAAPNGTIKIAAKTIDIEASGDSTIAAGADGMIVQTTGELTVKGLPVNIN